MKKITLLIALLILPTLAFAQSTLFNYPHLYRGMRSLGMGGAYTAVGGDAEGVFYNPATLYDMGFQLDLINPLVEVDQNAMDLSTDLQDAMDLPTDTERTNALLDIAEANTGKPLHFRVALFPSVAVKNFVVGFLGQGEADARLHNQTSRIVEVQGNYEYGPIGGASFSLPVTGLRLGIAGKYISRTSVNEEFSVNEIAADNFDIADYQVDNSDVSFDVGLLYELPVLTTLKPRVGISVLDITDLDFKEGGKIPQRINIGASMTANLPFLAEVILAADYEDIGKAYEQDDSTWKRVHLGGEFGLLDRHVLVRAGLNQGYPTYGAELDIWLIRLGYTFYSEEMGAYAGQDKDDRHLVQLTLGW